MKILVINAGSSSLKYQLIDMETEEVLAKGLCERIGIDGHLKHSPLVGGKPVFNEDLPMPTHSEAIAAVIDPIADEVDDPSDDTDFYSRCRVNGGTSQYYTWEGEEISAEWARLDPVIKAIVEMEG